MSNARLIARRACVSLDAFDSGEKPVSGERGPGMRAAIPPLEKADLPERTKAFWKMTGPGAVLVGLSIGAGEIVIWPRIAAQYGASMAWAAALGVFLQLWVNIEIARWTIATGESAYTAYARRWKGFIVAFFAFNVMGWLLPGWARASGSALKALLLGPTHSSPDWLWTGITFAGVALVLFGPKRVYTAVERTIGGLVVLVTVGLLIIAFKVGTTENVKELAAGVVNVGFREEGFSVKELFIAMVFAGAGGTANLFYGFYLRDKQIGMGGRIPVLLNPFRAREESAHAFGYMYEETPENARRFKDWFRFVLLDQTMYFWLLNTFTIFLFIFGALAVLHPAGIVPQSGTLIWDEANILAESMGAPGRYLFLLIGLATLFSTQVTLVDGVARSFGDLSAAGFEFARRAPHKTYTGFAIGIIVIGVVVTAILENLGRSELGFLFNAAYVGGFAMAVYTPLTLYLNLKHLPTSARPRPLNIVMMTVASIVYISFAIYCLGTELGWLPA